MGASPVGPFELRAEEAALPGVSYEHGELRLGPSGAAGAGLALSAVVLGFFGSVAVGVLAGFGAFGSTASGDPSAAAWAAEVLVLGAAAAWWWRASRCDVRADVHGVAVRSSLRPARRVAHADIAEIRAVRTGVRRGEPTCWERPELVAADGTVIVCRPLAMRVRVDGPPGPAAARAALLQRFHEAQR
ncbi:MAG: hypothetical protein R2755_27715 [Acidimicrobiales bacterium]